MTQPASAFNETVYIGLGSNLGDRKAHLARAVSFLKQSHRIRVDAVSSWIETDPWGNTRQGSFLNGALQLVTSHSPLSLLAYLKEGELRLGRTPSEHWGPRVIDMDILLFGERIINDTELTVPHVHLRSRAFVLAPLLELNPSLHHPECHTPLRDFLMKL
ncbi:MAG: 2-amino-4-hydroxy-6-hydroxymethyldihydropteridine diphosphokinase [Deltaproteobacteria bacterium]|nr:2-amino-4-hydroxy-6-hydroxymethyldihydropteridine diphosphokinase [Deltaproteobacteria bacterium]